MINGDLNFKQENSCFQQVLTSKKQHFSMKIQGTFYKFSTLKLNHICVRCMEM